MIVFVSHSGILERSVVSEASKIAFYSCKWFMCKILPCPKAAWIWQQVLVNFAMVVAKVLENFSEICLGPGSDLLSVSKSIPGNEYLTLLLTNMLIEIKISWTCKKSDCLRQLPLKCLVGSRAISGDFPSLAACKAGVYEAYFLFSALQTAHRWLRGSETFPPPALVPGHIQVGQCHWVTPKMGLWSCQHLCWDPALLHPPVKTLPGLFQIIPLSYQLPYL